MSTEELHEQILFLKNIINGLEARKAIAIEQLESFANEMVHHSKGCNGGMMVDWNDLQEVIDTLNSDIMEKLCPCMQAPCPHPALDPQNPLSQSRVK